MSNLRSLQRQFLEAILDRASSNRPLAFVEARGLTPAARMDIYRNNIQMALSKALEATYPVVVRLVGDDYFRYLARMYVAQTPSVSGNLEDYGAGFAEFIEEHLALHQLPYLADLARLEWALHEVYQAPASGPFGAEALAALVALPPDQVRLHINTASRLLASNYPILQIWNANQDNAGDVGVSLDAGGVHLLVHQRDLQVEILPIGSGDYAFLAGCVGNDDLVAAYEAASSIDPELDLGVCLDKFIRHGALTGWSLRSYQITKETVDECCQ